jgi:hypothetical protein
MNGYAIVTGGPDGAALPIQATTHPNSFVTAFAFTNSRGWFRWL